MANRSSFRELPETARLALANRVRETVEAIGTQATAADVAQVSLRQLKQYLSGEAAPSLIAAANLVRAAGFDLYWLATGSGRQERSADPTQPPMRLQRKLGRALEKVYEQHGAALLPDDIDELIEVIARGIVATTTDEAQWPTLIEGVAAMHKAKVEGRR